MAYTFGGAVGSRCAFTTTLTNWQSANMGVITGWYRPTTLTATRRYWGAGTVIHARVGTTTSEISMQTNNGTTAGVWTTSGAGIAVNTWWFVAWIWALNNTGPAGNWRVYVGTVETAPQEVTVNTTTSPVGNYTGSTAFTFGNDTNNSLSYRGDLADLSLLGTSATGAASLLNIAATTAITQLEADHIYQTWILPHWLGRPQEVWDRPVSVSCDYFYWPAHPLANVYRKSNQAVVTHVAPTLTSATVSANGNPRPLYTPALSAPYVNKR